VGVPGIQSTSIIASHIRVRHLLLKIPTLLVAEKQPKTLITDGAPNFHEAFMDEYWTSNICNRPEHIRDIRFDGQVHNNKMERMNGELRDREKVVRGVKREDSSLLTGLQIYHNYVRPHMGLNGKNPADVAGITVEGKDKWLTIIQNAIVEARKG
jgi:hypothetical protein